MLVNDIRPGTASSTPAHLTNVNGTLFFSATDGSSGIELWKSDGTSAGTVLVKDVSPGAAGSSPSDLAAVDGLLLFTADNGADGREPWQSDGTAAGTFLVEDIDVGAAGSSPAEFTSSCSAILFSAQEPAFGRELWGLPPAPEPADLSGLRVDRIPAGGSLQISWSSLDPIEGPQTRYDVVRGVLSALHASGFPGGATCARDDLPDTPYAETASACDASPGDGCWYLVRAQNDCGAGSYGAAALDAAGTCP